MTAKSNNQLDKFGLSLDRLKEALDKDIEADLLYLDAIFQRFEFTFENAWKAVKMTLKAKGEDCQNPRDCWKRAYRMGWIGDEEKFLALLKARNLTPDTYNRELAISVYETVCADFPVIETLYQNLMKENENHERI